MDRAPRAAGMRLLGWLLTAYAAIGVVFLLVALVVGGPLVARADRLTTSADRTLEAAAQAADAAANAFDGFDDSIQQARGSASSAADLSRATAADLDGVASAMNALSLLGTQPLAALGDQVGQSAEQVRQLGDELDGIGSSLDVNRDDIARVGVRMRELADELAAFQGHLTAERASQGLPLSWLFYGFILWQLLPVAAAGIGGAWLLRHTRVVMADPA